MKKSTGPSFIQRVLDLFSHEKDEPSVSTQPKGESVEHSEGLPDALPNKRRVTRAHNTSDKSYESNLDRYKHPSELHRGR